MRILKITVFLLFLSLSACGGLRKFTPQGNVLWPSDGQFILQALSEKVALEKCGRYFHTVQKEKEEIWVSEMTQALHDDTVNVIDFRHSISKSNIIVFVDNRYQDDARINTFKLGTHTETKRDVYGAVVWIGKKDYAQSPCLPEPDKGKQPDFSKITSK